MSYALTHLFFETLSVEVPTVIRTLRENNDNFEVKTVTEARKWAISVGYRRIIG